MRLTVLITAFVAAFASAAYANPDFWRHEWPQTDFTQTTIENWSEVMSGGPPKDGIPAVFDPQFIPAGDEQNIGLREPVMTLEIEGQTPRAYPIRYLTWHEIVNDVIGDLPVVVTFCPLCNSGVVFDRRYDGRTLSFGVSGKLRDSNMIMYDRETESWWQQALGIGIVGEYASEQLTQIPAWMESWEEFTERNPDGLVMAQPEYRRPYGQNPYVSYDSSHRPFLYSGEEPPHGIAALARVVRVGDRAWPVERIRDVNEITEAGIRISWAAGQASALDTRSIAEGRDVGTIRVRDQAGNDLPHDIMFAFSFHSFFPNGDWMLGQ
ncbi:DUF3179 domain-containing protein [Cochlodiniinecator piscidefendens]|uniref:DUF3179 domain-containing protein n=1 Tax=Cochlodiniinecator piscidefendens TaxID=2715756 RepID=UPI0014094C73|nr:DUF3179 domain-containing protein [Cochlodiniinecator piscidefendens]